MRRVLSVRKKGNLLTCQKRSDSSAKLFHCWHPIGSNRELVGAEPQPRDAQNLRDKREACSSGIEKRFVTMLPVDAY